MANTADLSFNVFALDRASKTFMKMADRVERLSDKLDELDRQKATPEIDVDVDRPMRRIRQFSDTSSGVMSGAMKIVSSRAIIMGTIVAAAFAAAPAAAALAATGITVAFGGALAAIGLIAAAQSEKVQKEFTELKDHVVARIKEISKPFEDTLMTIADVARDTFDAFAPALKTSFQQIAPVLSTFVQQFGDAFKELIPAIEPLTGAFDAIMEELGPQLGPLFEDIADSLIGLAKTVEQNADEFAELIDFVLHSIPGAISLIDKLAGMFVSFITTFRLGWEMFKDQLQSAKEIAVTVFAAIGVGWLTFQEIALKGIRFVVDAFLGFVSTLLEGAAKAFGWVPGVGDKLQSAATEFEEFRDGVRDTLDGAIEKTEDWKRNLERMPKEVKLEGDIQDLEEKIASAKRQLKDPDLTKPERSKIRARIDDLRAKVRQAKAELNGIPNETVTISAVVNLPNRVAGVTGVGGLVAHKGGLVTPTGIMPRMHRGGLAPDERPVILQTGERVLSRRENMEFESMSSGNAHVTVHAPPGMEPNSLAAVVGQRVVAALTAQGV